MKVWVFVEGAADQIALNALWVSWRAELGKNGWGIQIIPLDDKSRFFRKIGPRAAEKLANNERDLAVGLPDLYPNVQYESTKYRHTNLAELKLIQTRLVEDALLDIFSMSIEKAQQALTRFHPTALKHDLEMLLLAAPDELRKTLGTSETLGRWRHPVEEQNQSKPPKYVIEGLFRTKRGQGYRDTVHARAVLEQIGDIKKLFYDTSGQLECPIFKETVDWVAAKTGTPAYC